MAYCPLFSAFLTDRLSRCRLWDSRLPGLALEIYIIYPLTPPVFEFHSITHGPRPLITLELTLPPFNDTNGSIRTTIGTTTPHVRKTCIERNRLRSPVFTTARVT